MQPNIMNSCANKLDAAEYETNIKSWKGHQDDIYFAKMVLHEEMTHYCG